MRVAVVGGGWIAQSIVAAIEAAGSEVVGLCDLDEGRRHAWSDRAPTFESLDEAIAVAAPQVAFVLTPTATHAALAVAAMRAGLDVVIEKPLATSSAEVADIVGAAAATGRTALVEESYLWMPSHARAIADITSGRIGAPRAITHTFYGWQPVPEKVAAVAAANSTGWRAAGDHPWIRDHLVHLFALSKWLSGADRVAAVRSLGGPEETDVRGATWRAGGVDVVWVRASRGEEGLYGAARGLHTRVIGDEGYLDVLGEGGAWGDNGPRCALRYGDGSIATVEDRPDLLWEADVGYYPSAHDGAVRAALDALNGGRSRVYTAADAGGDVVATEALIDSASAHAG